MPSLQWMLGVEEVVTVRLTPRQREATITIADATTNQYIVFAGWGRLSGKSTVLRAVRLLLAVRRGMKP